MGKVRKVLGTVLYRHICTNYTVSAMREVELFSSAVREK